MARRLLLLVAVLVGLVGVAALALVILARRLDPEELGRRVAEIAEGSARIDLATAEARIEPFRGLELVSVTARAPLPSGDLEATLDRVVLRPRWWPLLSGRLVVGSIVLEGPRIDLRERRQPSGPAAGAGTRQEPAPTGARRSPRSPAGSAPRFDLSELRVEEGSLTVIGSDGASSLRLEGFAATLTDLALDPKAGRGLDGFSGRGRIEARRLELAGRSFDELSGELELTAGTLRGRNVSLATAEGRFVARSLEIDASSRPWRYRVDGIGDPVEIGRLVGGGEARGSLELAIEGRGPEAGGRTGSGTLILHAGALPAAPWLLRVAQVLHRPELVGSRYEETRLDFTVRDDQVEIAPFALRGDLLALEGQGSVSLAGPLDLGVTVRLRREGVRVDGVPDALLDLLTGGDGWVAVPLAIRGDRENPVVHADRKSLGRVLRETAISRLGGSGKRSDEGPDDP